MVLQGLEEGKEGEIAPKRNENMARGGLQNRQIENIKKEEG